MNYNQFYKKKDQLKRGRNAEERANLMRLIKAFLVCLGAGAIVGAIVIAIFRFAG